MKSSKVLEKIFGKGKPVTITRAGYFSVTGEITEIYLKVEDGQTLLLSAESITPWSYDGDARAEIAVELLTESDAAHAENVGMWFEMPG